MNQNTGSKNLTRHEPSITGEPSATLSFCQQYARTSQMLLSPVCVDVESQSMVKIDVCADIIRAGACDGKPILCLIIIDSVSHLRGYHALGYNIVMSKDL